MFEEGRGQGRGIDRKRPEPRLRIAQRGKPYVEQDVSEVEQLSSAMSNCELTINDEGLKIQ
jgi:hypothetical protein